MNRTPGAAPEGLSPLQRMADEEAATHKAAGAVNQPQPPVSTGPGDSTAAAAASDGRPVPAEANAADASATRHDKAGADESQAATNGIEMISANLRV